MSQHAAHRRDELQRMYVQFETEIEKLNQRVEQQARERFAARLLMTHPGVGPITALANEVFLGDPARFAGQQGTSQLCRDDPSRQFQWKATATGWSNQTRQSAAALSLE